MSPASSSSARAKPFLFERSFDDPSKVYLPGEKFGPKVKVDLPKPKAKSVGEANESEKAEAAEPPPPPPKTFTEAELEAAREEGYVKGHTAALEEAETAREHYVADALNIVSKSLDGLEEQQAEANREVGETAMRLVYAVIEKVVPAHAQANAVESVEALVRDVLPLVYDEPTLIVRTHNMIADDVQARMEDVVGRSNFRGSVTVAPDYELQPGDCRVDWQGGGADRSESRLWKDIRAIVEENIGPVDVDGLDAAADAEVDHSSDQMDADNAISSDIGQDESPETEQENPEEAGTGDADLDLAHAEDEASDLAGVQEPEATMESAGEAPIVEPEAGEEESQEPEQPAQDESMINQDDDRPEES